MGLRQRKQTPLVQVRGLRKIFKKGKTQIHALKGIDLIIKAGERVAIAGVSGAGKTTLLHILGTLDRPTQGEVLYQGGDIFSRPERTLAESRNRVLGLVLQ